MATEIQQLVEHYMDLPYRVELTPSGDGWFVRLPDLPYCMSQGDTVGEAMEMIRDAQRGWLYVTLENGNPVPEPREPGYDDDEHSGQFNVRLPKSLHRDLVRAAKAEGVSLNLFIATQLARSIGGPAPRRRGKGQLLDESA